MTTGFRNSSGVDFDSLFDPYVQGTSPSATGLRLSSGVDLAGRFAPITFGSKGPDVGFRTSAGVDVSNLWAAIGTASYALPINGTTYTIVATGATSSTAWLQFATTPTTWSVSGFGTPTSTPGTGTYANGTLPAGASTVQMTTAVVSGAGGVIANSASSAVSVASNQSARLTMNRAGSGPTVQEKISVTIVFRNSGGSVISTSIIYFDVSAAGP